jgi:glycerol kinase
MEAEGIKADQGGLILAIDQGTTGTTALLLDLSGVTIARKSVEFPQHFPRPGWVEHEPEEIWRSVLAAVDGALAAVPASRDRLAAIGITNQRETIVLWDAASSQPVGPAIVWQDRRTQPRCEELVRAGFGDRVREVTGLVIDPYFSATKVEWLLRQDPGLERRARSGDVQLGTIDGFLVKKLCGGPSAPHVMEATNASRTLLMDLASCAFSQEMCDLFGIPAAMLPTIVPTAGVVAYTSGVTGLPDGIPISGIAGDQQAALFGQGCLHVGDVKCTYGTGAFVLANVGKAPVVSRAGLLSTLAWQLGGEATYALEGSCFVSGAAVQWLRDGLGLIAAASDIEALARSVPSSAGVVFVPALAGLGAPHWDPLATGLITGITRGTTRAHLARATLEAMALSVDDLVGAMSSDLKDKGLLPVGRLRVDGGASQNDLLLELQAAISRVPVERPSNIESTARGAALLAGLGAGLFGSAAAAAERAHLDRLVLPDGPQAPPAEQVVELRRGWADAVARTKTRSVVL